VSDLSDLEREALATIECDFGARYTRLARRLTRPGRFNRLRWGVIRKYLPELAILLTAIFTVGASARLSGRGRSPTRLFRVGY
jgi:hypothetical protein